jgi:hypothetical protein
VAMVDVRFDNMHINDCPEAGTCDWKLFCGLGGLANTELFGITEKNTGGTIEINRPSLVQQGGLPVTVTCSVQERDGPFLFFDDPVWEHVGTVSTPSSAAGQGSIQINQNDDEGDVTVNLTVTALGVIQQPSVPSEPPPLAPTGCGVAHASTPSCGAVSFECDAPLPVDEIFVAGGGGGGIRPYRVVHDIGLINAEYMSEGETIVAVCARNSAGVGCSNRFAVTLGPSFCPGPAPPPRQCPSGQILCASSGVCEPLPQCEFLQ